MTKQQELVFWNTISAFDELGILKNIMIIGSWAEYLYPKLFETDFIPNLVKLNLLQLKKKLLM